MKEFNDIELFDMFSVGGCQGYRRVNLIDSVALLQPGGMEHGGAGLQWGESAWGNKTTRRGGQRQHNGGQGITVEQRRILVAYRRKLVEQNGTSFDSADLDAEFFLSVPQDWKKIVGILDN